MMRKCDCESRSLQNHLFFFSDIITCDKMHRSQLWSLMDPDICVHLGNHHSNHDVEHCYYYRMFPCAPFQLVSIHPHPGEEMTVLISIAVD